MKSTKWTVKAQGTPALQGLITFTLTPDLSCLCNVW